MPILDRRITLNVQAMDTFNNQGEHVPGIVTPIQMWATRNDLSTEDIAQAGGVSGVVTRDYIIRFREQIAMTPPKRMSIVDGASTLAVINMTEARQGYERRKFIRLSATGETTP